MLTRDKQVKELKAQLDLVQERLDRLRSDFDYLEDFVTKKLGGHIDDRFKELEDYLNIERVKSNTYYRSKETK